MDARCVQQIRGFWPDLVESLIDIVPDGCLAVRLRDRWRELPTRDDERIRGLDLISLDGDINELRDDVRVEATGDGWRLADSEDAPPRDTLERGDAILRLHVDQLEIGPLDAIVLRVEIEQPWRADVAPPVENSELFVDACRKALQLHDWPVFIEKDVILDMADLSRSIWMRERIRYNTDTDILTHIRKAGYAPVDDRWRSWHAYSTAGDYRVDAKVDLHDTGVEMELTRTRRPNPLVVM